MSCPPPGILSPPACTISPQTIGDGSIVATATEDEAGEGTVAVSSPTGIGHAKVDAKALLTTEIPDLYKSLRGDQIVEELVAQAFKEADKDKDELIDLEEFTRFVKKHPQLTDWFDILAV